MRELESFRTKLNQNYQWPPVEAPTNIRREEPWRSQLDDSINAVSFGFVATAVLISLFFIMALLERLIRTTTTTNSDPSPGLVLSSLDSRVGFNGSASSKLGYQSPQIGVYSKGVSVLMPGNDTPTFIGYPAPVPSPTDSNSHNSSPNSIQEYYKLESMYCFFCS